MKIFQTLFLCILITGMFYVGNAQNSGVHAEYLKDSKQTKVETSTLYIYNTPEQFVELALRAWYKGEKLTAPPTKVDVEIFSFSKNPLYPKEKDRPLVVVADGSPLPMGSLTNTVMMGETKNGTDSFYAVGAKSGIGVQVPVPASAQIKAGGSLNGITMEWMSLSMKPDQFLKFSKGAKLELQIGHTSIKLNDRQTEIIHNFASQITPH